MQDVIKKKNDTHLGEMETSIHGCRPDLKYRSHSERIASETTTIYPLPCYVNVHLPQSRYDLIVASRMYHVFNDISNAKYKIHNICKKRT
ncbi:hypothetical protein SPOG_05706 [Schizosaccharomyces cryophilus OY26]|uniref:Uncharacterized protein n=1 Tax=Schizosaccharomyces cryophilus (strain OY26 / ATCC MYA-4695 / CBS 11777 / NBRC 106824 / NRRL Y48691) TaxID=653667 RepID=S9X8G2_SCHCR|nr:uncharacterized protein SPOG_05706 [Schizosaccharomyces cryophilus OY26]EPY53412.1 hypothetical protein SPOG_05706 [Schizosaccharomyces cryophilus OY26]